jgi:hypothetical protein
MVGNEEKAKFWSSPWLDGYFFEGYCTQSLWEIK